MEENKCPYCKHNNKIEYRFCSQCGSRLEVESINQPRLVLFHGDRNNAIYRLDKTFSSIGRDNKNMIVLNDSRISKQHAVISYEHGEYWIKDLNSKNGIYLNGRKVELKERLFHGCLIKLGSTVFRFEVAAFI